MANPWEQNDMLVPTWEQDDPLVSAGVPTAASLSFGNADPVVNTARGQGFWRSLVEDPEEKVPFVGGAIKAGRFIGTIEAAQRLQSDFDYSKLTGQARAKAGLIGWVPSQARRTTKDADVKLVEDYLREANKKYTGLGQVGRIVGEMPAFMVEFLATGGLKQLGEKGAIKIAERLLKGQAKNILTRSGVGLAKYASGAALRSAGLPQRAAVAVLKRQLPKGISYGPNGEINIKGSGETWATSVMKGLGDHYIEILSEQAGEIVAPAMGKALKRTPFLGKVLAKTQAKWLSLHKSSTALDFANKLGTKAGFNGIISEIGEEFYGDQLRAIFDVDDFGAGKDAGMLERMSAAFDQDLKNLPVMAAAFAVPGVGRAALGFAAGGDAPIAQQGTNAVSEVQHQWTPEEIDTTFGAGINEALAKVQSGEMDVDEIVEMSELQEIEERKIQGLPSIAEQTVDADEFEKRVSDQATEFMKEGMPQERAWDWARKQVSLELEEELGTQEIITGKKAAAGEGKQGTLTMDEFAEELATGKRKPFGRATSLSTEDQYTEYLRKQAEVTPPAPKKSAIKTPALATAEPVSETKPPAAGAIQPSKGKPAGPADVDVTPEKGKIEFYDQKAFESPKTTVVKELAKLVSTGLTVDEAVSTLQELRTSKTQELTHKEQIQIEVEEIAEVLKQANPDAFTGEVIGSRKSKTKEFVDAAKDNITHYHWGHMRIGRMLEWLDGKTDGPLKEHIWKPMRAAVAQSALGRSYRMKQLNGFLQELGVSVKELYSNRVEIREGLTLRPVDMLEVFLATKDKEKLRNLKEGNNLSDEDVQDVLGALIQDERMIQLGHWLLKQYSSDFAEISEKYNKTTGQELPRIQGYSAIRRVPEGRFARFINADQEFDDLLPQLMGGHEFKKKSVPKSMTLKRTRATGPLNLDALSNYIAHARAAEHYKAMAIPVFNINQMIHNNDFRKVVQQKTRGAGNSILSKWVQDVASERTTLENDWLSRTLGVLRRNAVVSALGLNIVTALKQPLSLSLAAAENPKMIPGIIAAFAEGARSPSALKKFVHDRSVVVRHRNMEREIREMASRRSVRKQIGGTRALSEKSLVLIRMMDQATVHVVWKAAYDMALGQEGEEQAISYADSVVERTQPMADIMDLPHFFRGSELHKMFTLFQNQINQNYNYWAHDIVGATKRGEISKEMVAYRVLMSYVLPSQFLGLISFLVMLRQAGKDE